MKSAFIGAVSFFLIQVSFGVLTEVFLCSGLAFVWQYTSLTNYGLCHFSLEKAHKNK